MKDNPLISVVIPVFNRQNTISYCLNSVLAQTYKDFVVIVVDDCSTDNSFKIAEGLKRKLNGRLQLIRNSTNQGVSRSRNIAFQAAQGEYIAFLDADDRWHPMKLEMQIKLFETVDKTTHMVHTGVEAFADLDTVEWLKNSNGLIKSLDNWELAWNNQFLSGKDSVRVSQAVYHCHPAPILGVLQYFFADIVKIVPFFSYKFDRITVGGENRGSPNETKQQNTQSSADKFHNHFNLAFSSLAQLLKYGSSDCMAFSTKPFASAFLSLPPI